MDEQNEESVDEQNLQRIKGHLQKKDAQERIKKSIEDARSRATVTISRAAHLFGFSENQLRDWEKRFRLLKTDRPLQEGKSTAGHRQYSPGELDKLAVIKELIGQGGFAPADIPQEIDTIWESISQQQPVQALKVEEDTTGMLPINVRIENARAELFWRYYASHALRLSLSLISEELPGTPVGLVLPLRPGPDAASVRTVEDLPKLGPSLVGWLSKTGSSHTLFTPVPSFQYNTDYSLLSLAVMKDDKPLEEPKDNTRIVLDRRDRRSKLLSLSASVVETIQNLLAPLYKHVQSLRLYFGPGMRDELDPAPNLDSSTERDNILDGLADMVVCLGGHTSDGQDRWRFCCILLPKDPSLPLQQHTLVVRAQSPLSPHKIGGTTVSPDKSISSLSLRAYQSGHVIYRPRVIDADTSIAHPTVEGPVRSALAVPIGWENGSVVAVLYVVSYETEAFSESHQRVLRMVGRMIEEVILTYRTRRQVVARLTNAIDRPGSVDPLFENFSSESDFVNNIEDLLTILKAQLGESKEPKPKEIVPLDERKARYRAWEAAGEVVSFIAVDIDDQSSLATKYGDQVARNLSKAVGLRIQDQQRPSTNPEHRKLYHIYADHFYLILKDMTLEEARNKAKQLRDALNGDYRVEARRASAERLMLPERMLELSDVTVRLGVSAYPYRKLKELLQRFPVETAMADVRAEIMRAIDGALNLGQQEGGNTVVSWDVDSWDYIRWYPPR